MRYSKFCKIMGLMIFVLTILVLVPVLTILESKLSFTKKNASFLGKYDPNKSNNPFAYFTQIIHYAFLRRIQREKRQLEIKNKILEKSGFSEVFTDDNTIDGGNYSDYNSIKDGVHSKLRY